ncbi:MAG: NAD(P)H-dependent oxidoreductase [Bergeyella sp.]|nr:NAD(P)H-dependent oxidoreductase [Bergeyella sp.]
MEGFLDKMNKRYAVKKYNPNYSLDKNTIEKLKEVLRLSPSSINSQPWKFTFVTQKEVKDSLALCSCHNTEKIKDSSLLIVFQVMKNIDDFEKHLEENLPPHTVEYYHARIKPLGEEEIKSWMRNQVYISLGILLAACAEMEIDSTAMGGIQPEKYDEILKNDRYTTLFAVCIGKRHEEDTNMPTRRPKTRIPVSAVVDEV